MPTNDSRRIAVLIAVLVALVLAGVGGAAQTGQTRLAIDVLSSRPDMVSGNDALVQVSVPSGTASDRLVVAIDGRDVSRVFHPSDKPNTLVGLLEGLRVGKNVLRATAGAATGQVELTNYPITGPIVSGPHLKPFDCRTVESGLGAPLDVDCSAQTKIEYFYHTRSFPGFVGGEFKPLPDPRATLPNDIAEVTTREGRQVPYIVRVESGTINRAIYRIAVLDDPRDSDPAQPWRPGPTWNRRLVMSFGGGCGVNYNQGVNDLKAGAGIGGSGVLGDAFLSRGFAHMVSTLNVLGQLCNDELSGETFMMLKEHFIERYGVPVWTAGEGGSGGSMQQVLIAQNFPGLLDGLMPARSFPDAITTWNVAIDCRLMQRYFAAHTTGWTTAQRQAVEGTTPGTCRAWDNYVDSIVASRACGIPKEKAYDPVTNPKGARCTVWDSNVATYGRDPVTSAARTAYDNVGVQYGLQALNAGTITNEQFLDLNVAIGGFDRDGIPRAERAVADAEAVRLAYAAGRVNSGGGSLATIPILHYRGYLDDVGDVHSRVHDFLVRERLRHANGRVDNQVIWTLPASMLNLGMEAVLDTMTEWLDNVAKDTSVDPMNVKVARAKPANAVDACWDKKLTRINEPLSMDSTSACNKIFPIHSTTRLSAGEPIYGDVLECQLKPVSRADYKIQFSDAEWQRMTKMYTGGVCDYAKPGVNAGKITGIYQVLPLLENPAASNQSANAVR